MLVLAVMVHMLMCAPMGPDPRRNEDATAAWPPLKQYVHWHAPRWVAAAGGAGAVRGSVAVWYTLAHAIHR